MKTLTLNIGLDTNDGSPAIKLHWAYLLLNNRFAVIDSRVDISPNGGEITIVAVVEKHPDLVDKLHDLCLRAKQDCIATSDGDLIGPCAEKWGKFNPEFFVEFDAPQDNSATVKQLRDSGHGVIVWTPGELEWSSPNEIQDVCITAGNEHLENLTQED